MLRTTSRFASVAVLLLATAGVVACAGVRPSSQRPAETEPGGMVISREQVIASGARTAMEAIERSRTHLTISRTRAGDPVTIRHRGIDSFLASPEVLLVVDGSRVSHPAQALDDIPARTITYIQILTGREAVMRWGSESGNGVIVIKTAAY